MAKRNKHGVRYDVHSNMCVTWIVRTSPGRNEDCIDKKDVLEYVDLALQLAGCPSYDKAELAGYVSYKLLKYPGPLTIKIARILASKFFTRKARTRNTKKCLVPASRKHLDWRWARNEPQGFCNGAQRKLLEQEDENGEPNP
jgi:hypothetical protein